MQPVTFQLNTLSAEGSYRRREEGDWAKLRREIMAGEKGGVVGREKVD